MPFLFTLHSLYFSTIFVYHHSTRTSSSSTTATSTGATSTSANNTTVTSTDASSTSVPSTGARNTLLVEQFTMQVTLCYGITNMSNGHSGIVFRVLCPKISTVREKLAPAGWHGWHVFATLVGTLFQIEKVKLNNFPKDILFAKNEKK